MMSPVRSLAFGLIMAAVACASPTAETGLTGAWGGQHIALVTTETGAALEYDCAAGTIDGPLAPDGEGRFLAHGTHVIGQGGPVRQDQPPDSHPASYLGMVAGDTMTLTVTLTDSGIEIGTFSLTRGADPRIVRCL